MARIDTSVMVHKLNANPEHRPVKQKRSSYPLKSNQLAIDEVEKLLQAGFIRELHYSEWLVNVVMVKKPNGK
jgi:hypothetical protein